MPASQPPILHAEGIGKIYHVMPRLRSLLTAGDLGPDSNRVAALDSISLSVAAGEAVAIVGANGAGKSTLLRVLAGLSLPTHGSVTCRARVGTLLDLGAGLVDEWSGETNAQSALALQGESRARVSEIARFAEIGAFFGQPVRTYSTGMRLRLAYALAMGLSPEVLIADEIVAVGDESFQRRCALELQRFLAGGGTLVLATHNLYLADKLCQRALWLQGGKVRQCGPTRDVTAAYRDTVLTTATRPQSRTPAFPANERQLPTDPAHASLAIESALDEGGHNVVSIGAPWSVRVEGGADLSAAAWIDLRRADGTLVSRLPVRDRRLDFAPCNLLPGRFSLELCEPSAGAGMAIRARETLLIRGTRRELGCVVLDHEWL